MEKKRREEKKIKKKHGPKLTAKSAVPYRCRDLSYSPFQISRENWKQ